MKKALFIIAALASCMTVSAKYWFSGSIGVDSKSLYSTDEKARYLDFSPAFGMAIEDEIELGVALGIVDNCYYRNATSVQQMFSFSFAPFIRYTFLTEGNFNLFVQGGFEYKVTSPSGFNYWQLGLNVQPGIRYMMSDHWSVVAMCKGLTFTHMSEPEAAGSPEQTFKNEIGLGINTALSLGLVYEF